MPANTRNADRDTSVIPETQRPTSIASSSQTMVNEGPTPTAAQLSAQRKAQSEELDLALKQQELRRLTLISDREEERNREESELHAARLQRVKEGLDRPPAATTSDEIGGPLAFLGKQPQAVQNAITAHMGLDMQQIRHIWDHTFNTKNLLRLTSEPGAFEDSNEIIVVGGAMRTRGSVGKVEDYPTYQVWQKCFLLYQRVCFTLWGVEHPTLQTHLQNFAFEILELEDQYP